MSALTVNDGLRQVGARRAALPRPGGRGGRGPRPSSSGQRGVVVTGSPAAGRGAPTAPELAAVESPTMGELVGGHAAGERQRHGRAAGEGARAPGGGRGLDRRRRGGGAARRWPTLGLPTDGRHASWTARASTGATPLTCGLLVALLDRAEDDGSVLDAGLAVAGTQRDPDRAVPRAPRWPGGCGPRPGRSTAWPTLAGFVETETGGRPGRSPTC